MQRANSLKKTLVWERLRAGEGDDRRWDGGMATPNRWKWVWINSGSWWWTGMSGVLQSMGSQRIRHNWATEQQQKWLNISVTEPNNQTWTLDSRSSFLPLPLLNSYYYVFFPFLLLYVCICMCILEVWRCWVGYSPGNNLPSKIVMVNNSNG